MLSLYFMLSGDYMPWWIYPYIFWCFFGSTIIHIISSFIVSLFVLPFLQCLVARVNIDWPHTLYILCLCLFCSVTPSTAIHLARTPLVYHCISSPYSVVCA